jgi:beta-phosphoglucomutase
MNKMKKEIAFIFDLDGVIVDTAKYHFSAWKNLAKTLGFKFTEKQNELLKGVSRVKSLEILLKIGNVHLSEEKKQQLLIEKNTEYLGFVNKMTSKEILPGVNEILSFLEANNIEFALGSASKNAPLILKKVGLLNRFTAIVDGNDVSKAKPDPEVFLIGAQKLTTKPENCVVFEDAIAGVQAANVAQMLSIGIGDEKVLSEANYVFKNMSDITSIFLKTLIN